MTDEEEYGQPPPWPIPANDVPGDLVRKVREPNEKELRERGNLIDPELVAAI